MPPPHPHSPYCPNLCSVPCDPGHFSTAWPGWTPDPKEVIQVLASGPLTSVPGAVGWAGLRVSLRRWEMERLPGWRPWGRSGAVSPWSQPHAKYREARAGEEHEGTHRGPVWGSWPPREGRERGPQFPLSAAAGPGLSSEQVPQPPWNGNAEAGT